MLRIKHISLGTAVAIRYTEIYTIYIFAGEALWAGPYLQRIAGSKTELICPVYRNRYASVGWIGIVVIWIAAVTICIFKAGVTRYLLYRNTNTLI